MHAIPPNSAGEPAKKVRHHPRIAQAKRSWYFFRRNTLALIGLAVLVIIGAVAAYAATMPMPWYTMPTICGTDYGPSNGASNYPGPYNDSALSSCPYVCTYTVTPPPNAGDFCGGQWYKTPSAGVEDFAGMVPPTWSTSPASAGPLPLGSLATTAGFDSAQFYNMYAGLLRGSDWSLMFSVAIVGIGATVGLLVGAVAGFFGGLVDEALMRIVDVFLSIPVTLFVVVVVLVASAAVPTLAGLDSSATRLLMLVLGFAIVWWPFYARLVRGQVLVTREQKYIEAARASGASRGRTLVKHIIPNSVFPIFIQFSLDVGTIPLLIGGLAYLGFGPQLFPNAGGPFPEWGNLATIGVNDIAGVLQTCINPTGCVIPWWQLFFPGLVLFCFAISVNLLSDGLRDAFDPRLRR